MLRLMFSNGFASGKTNFLGNMFLKKGQPTDGTGALSYGKLGL